METLNCVECGATTEEGRGWRAEYVRDDEEQDLDEVVVYCRECWDYEYGDR